MSATPSVRTESLGGSALSRAARAGELAQWYKPVPRGGAWRAYADEVRASVDAGWFDDLVPAIDATGAAAARLGRSAGGKGIVVTTGQQPGLFGGPLMTFVKALSARALADVLQEATSIPVAPVFWAATDDADFDEASVMSVVTDGGARAFRLQQRPPAGTPMAHAPLDRAEVDALALVLREASGSAPHASYLESAIESYRRGKTVGGAYVALLRQVLEPLGIAVLDASHPSVFRAAAPLLGRAAAEADLVAAAVDQRDEDLSAKGFAPQVEKVKDMSLVFSNVNGIKRRLPIGEAMALGHAGEGNYLSSTVLLRPVLERAILPTAAYLGGPGEVAYFAQVTAVATALRAAVPLVLPRWSTTIVESRVQAILDRLGVGVEALADPHAVENEVARAHLPSDADRALRSLRDDLVGGIESLKHTAGELVPDSVLDGLRRSLEHRFERTERRLVAGVKRREADMMRMIGTARGSLYPHGVRQERKLAYIPFLARYGPELIDQMLSAAQAYARSLVVGAPVLTSPTASTPAKV